MARAGSSNQARRTRQELLRAAAVLMRQGLTPTLEEVAAAALVSRATAYRYFPGVEPLLLEASFDIATPEAGTLFRDGPAADPVARVQLVDAALHAMTRDNEAALRLMLAKSLEHSIRPEADRDTPPRQNRRSPLIEAALAPARDRLDPARMEVLARALALIIGPEAMVVLQDVLQLPDEAGRAVKRWAIAALVEAALRDQEPL